MIVLLVASLTPAFPKCCLPWYILRSFGLLRNILLSHFLDNVRTTQFARLDSPRLTQIGYRNVIQDYQTCKKSFFEITTYRTTISSNICWQHWNCVTALPCGQTPNWL